MCSTRALAVAAILNTFALGATPALTAEASATSAHDFTFDSIDGGPLALADYAGRPVLVVNTASRCGFTPQYEGLQALWEKYRDRGLVVIGTPSNDFNQELADESSVKEFCEVNFAIDFPMTTIIHVTGAEAHPFYAWADGIEGAPNWNFSKYLIDGDGKLVDSWSAMTRPASLEDDIEALLPKDPS